MILPIKKEIARYIHYYPMGTTYSNGYVVIGEGFSVLRIPSPPGSTESLDAMIRVKNWWESILIWESTTFQDSIIGK